MKKIITLKDVIDLAFSRDGRCLSNIYINNKTNILWECHKKHVWSASYGNIVRGSWCPECAGLKAKTINDMKQLASKKGGTVVSKKYKNMNVKIRWSCSVGHVWEAKPSDISNGSWCPRCAGNGRLSIQDAHEIAKLNNGQCLSSEYKNIFRKLEWACDQGHIWSAVLKDVRDGCWCPECSFVGQTQKKLFYIIKDLFPNCNVKFNYRKFDWLINPNTGKKLEIDILVYNTKDSPILAIEYDGKQHFKPTGFGSSLVDAIKGFYNIKKTDKIKNEIIPQHIKYFIRFNYKENINKDIVIYKLQNNGIKFGDYL